MPLRMLSLNISEQLVFLTFALKIEASQDKFTCRTSDVHTFDPTGDWIRQHWEGWSWPLEVEGQYLRLLTLVLWVTHSVCSVSLSCALIPAVRMSTQCRVKSIVRTCTFFSPEKWSLALTFESLWPYQQWNACDKSHLERAVAKRASVCKSISIYPPRCPLFFLMWPFYPAGEALTRCHERTRAASALKGAPCHVATPRQRFFRWWVCGKSSSANVYHMT